MTGEKEKFDRRCCWVMVPMGLFLLLRTPLVFHQPGGQDEQVFAVPGWTVSQTGIPRVPYLPTRQRATFYENADRCLMALPPGLFYCQAPFYWMMPAGYPPGRMPLLVGAVLSIGLVAGLAWRCSGSWFVAFCAALMLALSRPLMFTGILARPDLLCMLCGWSAISILWTAQEDASWRRFSTAGGLCGLGGLFHPFALVFCIQCGVWTLLMTGTLKIRIQRGMILAVFAIVVLSAWVPLIVAYPHEFRSQFFANVVERAGPGLTSRLINPLPSCWHHVQLIWVLLGVTQTVFYAIGICVGLLQLFAIRHPFRVRLSWLMLSSVYLTATVAGLHPTKGYWVYPTFYAAIIIAIVLLRLVACCQSAKQVFVSQVACVVFVILVSLPGGGVKSAVVYLRHWGDPQYHAGNFIKQTLQAFPEEGIYLSDSPYVFDIYLSGRTTLLLQDRELFWGDEPIPYRYIIAAGEGIQDDWPQQYDSKFLRLIGTQAGPQNCFLNIYGPANGSKSR